MRSPLRVASWLVLGGLLVATVVAAATFDRAEWPSLIGDEATYAMQAASLGWELDLAYDAGDYLRFVEQWGRPPEGLILQSRDDGAHITFGKPALYALALAPATRLAPVRGPVVTNALLLAAAALLAAWSLERRVGPAAPLWVACFVFASVSFAYVFWIHADLFLMCATAAGLALVWRAEPAPAPPAARDRPRGSARDLPQVYEPPGGSWEAAAPGRPLLRWFAAGLLLAVPGAFRPFYLVLLVPALLALRAEARGAGGGSGVFGRRLAAFALGAVLLLAGSSLLQFAAGGAWTSYGGERQGFYERTGFPDVDFPPEEWDASVERWGNTSWLFPGAVADYAGSWDWDLARWNALYFLAGRTVGVLPYFLPLLLAFAAFSPRHGRWALPLAVLVAAVAFFVVRPFNFYGGTGAIANRYFLPLYPALWFVAARPPRAAEVRGRAVLALVAAVAAAPFLLPTWSSPRGFPVTPDGRYRHVSEVAREWLPYETTQSHIPGGQDFAARGLWVRLLTPGAVRFGDDRMLLTGAGDAEILIATPAPLTSFVARFGADAPARVPLEGAELRNTVLHPNGGVSLILAPERPRAVHPMWWTPDDWTLYTVEIPADAAPGATLTLAAGGGG